MTEKRRARALIIGAMEREVSLVISCLKSRVNFSEKGYSFCEGFFNESFVVVCVCGIGGVDATYALCKLTNLYDFDFVFNIGCCGAHICELTYGNIILPNKLVFLPSFFGGNGDATYSTFSVCERLFKRVMSILDELEFPYASGAFFSADLWNKKENISLLATKYSTLGEDMEAGALNYICQREGIAFSCLKFVSNNELTNEKYSLYDGFEKFQKSVIKILEKLL